MTLADICLGMLLVYAGLTYCAFSAWAWYFRFSLHIAAMIATATVVAVAGVVITICVIVTGFAV